MKNKLYFIPLFLFIISIITLLYSIYFIEGFAALGLFVLSLLLIFSTTIAMVLIALNNKFNFNIRWWTYLSITILAIVGGYTILLILTM